MSTHASWTNWSVGVTCTPARLAMPESEAALLALFREAERAGWEMRVAGTGHSFVPLCTSAGGRIGAKCTGTAGANCASSIPGGMNFMRSASDWTRRDAF